MPQIKCSSTHCVSNKDGVCVYPGAAIQITSMGCQNFDPKSETPNEETQAAMEELEQGGGSGFAGSTSDFMATLADGPGIPAGGGAECSAAWAGPEDQGP